MFKFLPIFRVNFKNNKISNKFGNFDIENNNLNNNSSSMSFDYVLFNRLFRCIDLAVLDFEHVAYDCTKFICALLYLVVGTYTNTFDETYIENFIVTLDDLTELDTFYNLNSIIDGFLADFFNIGLNDIAEYINIAAIYYSLTKVNQEKVNTNRSVSLYRN